MKNSAMDILLIEDNPMDAALIGKMLSEVRGLQYSVEHVQSLSEGLDLLQKKNYISILLDLNSSTCHISESIAAIRNHEKHAPIIILTELDGEDMAITALNIDIQDYLFKSELNSNSLHRTISCAIQRNRAVEELRRSERKFATIFQAAPVLLDISKPIGGEIINVNDSLLATCGYKRNEMGSRTDQELCIWETPADRDKVVRALLEQGPVRDLEINFRDKSGQPVIGLMSAELIEIDGEKFMLSLVKDITEQKRTEEENRLLIATLASRASELESTNEELAAFNYTVSHDLRQPLNNIGTACQVIDIMSGDKLDDEEKKCIKIAIDGVMHMSDLIGTLLKFSNSAHSILHLEKVDLTNIAKIISAQLRLTDPERNVTFIIAEEVKANGDSELLNVVLENLLNNAWKYTGAQQQTIIEFGSTEKEGTPVYFLKDNGHGFGMVDAEKLFIPFKRLSGTIEYSGHGIGLATVERIIRRHQGRVWAEGEPGKGATFYFTLGQQSD